MKLVLFFFLLSVSLPFYNTVYGQQNRLSQAKSEQEEFETLIELSRANFSELPKKSLEYAEKAIVLAQKTGVSDNIATALLNKATAFYYLGMPDSAEKYCLEVINGNLTGKNALSKMGFAYNMVSIINKTKGNYSKALKYAALALDIQRKRNNKFNYAVALNTVAGILKRKGEYHRALDSFYKVLDISATLNDTVLQMEAYNNIANLYMDISNDSMAEEYYKKAIDLCYDTLSQEYAGLLCNLGIVKYNEKDYEGAITNYYKALSIYMEKGNILESAGIYQNLGNAYIEKKEYTEGINMLRKAYEVFKKENQLEDMSNVSLDMGNGFLKIQENDSAYRYISRALKTADSIKNFYIKNNAMNSLYRYYYKKGDYKSAIDIYGQYIAEKDSVTGIEVKNKILELKTKYETEKKENEITYLKKSQAIEKSKNRLLIALLVLSAVVFSLIIVIFVVRRKTEKQKQQLIIEKQKLKVDYLAKENEYKSNQLATHALHMMQKNRLLKELQNELTDVEKSMDDTSRDKIRKLKRAITKNINTEKDWNIFKRYFEFINPDFFGKLKNRFPQLTNYDIRLAALIKLNLNNNEIATALNITPGSVKTSRHRLKKKLNLDKNTDLERFISTI